MSNSSPFHIGTARREMTPYVPGIGMMGFAMHFHVVHDVDMPIFARAMVFRTGEQKLAIVHADIAFITLYIRKRVLQVLDDKHSALGYTEHNLMLTATHTHSAPGGYSEYGLYNIQIAGFNQAVAETYVNGIVDALVAADANQHPANLRVGKSTFAEDTPVAFNRAWEAYSANDDTEDIDHANRHLAVDREMVQLSAHREDGTPWGWSTGLRCIPPAPTTTNAPLAPTTKAGRRPNKKTLSTKPETTILSRSIAKPPPAM